MSTDPLRFHGSFTRPEPIPERGIAAALELMRSGRLHRYDVRAGEESEAAALEREYAAWQGRRYCLATASGGAALQIALRAVGVRPGDPVLTNAFTLAPVPGAIHAVGGVPVLVEITEDLVTDFDDLAAKARESGARVLLLSLMRGHLPDMERLAALVADLGLVMIEDCAHTMGAAWNGRRSGNFGAIGCFSTQTYKHMNSGEGGLLVTDDDRLMARAIVLSGSYMFYRLHGTVPPEEAFAEARYAMPNLSARMDNLRAAILRPQLATLDERIRRWDALYEALVRELAGVAALRIPKQPPEARRVGSSLQFAIPGIDRERAKALVRNLAARGVEIHWFGAEEPEGYTSHWRHWRYVPACRLPRTEAILSVLFDMRLPPTFSVEDCRLVGRILAEEVRTVAGEGVS